MTSETPDMIEFNGESLAVSGQLTVTQLIQQQAVVGRRLVIVQNDEIVPKAQWPTTRVEAGDRIDIVSPVSGG